MNNKILGFLPSWSHFITTAFSQDLASPFFLTPYPDWFPDWWDPDEENLNILQLQYSNYQNHRNYVSGVRGPEQPLTTCIIGTDGIFKKIYLHGG